MQDLGLSKVGINEHKTIYRNLSYDELFKHETDSSLEGYEKGFVTSSGAVAVETGRFTGRSPKDKYIVEEETSKDNVWWAGAARPGSDNKPISEETWEELKSIAQKQLNGKNLYIIDAFCGANPETRINVRVITEVAWMAHFAKNMFIRPTDAELENFNPDFTILHACKATNPNFEKHGLRSEVFAGFNIKQRMAAIGGTWYGGEIKKGIFSMMNYFLPLKGIGAFHCSANEGQKGDTALFFGLSGTGKTTLSTDPDRALIGDDEHGWDNDGIFNFEGGCYAKTIHLSEENEPDIYRAIKKDALLENVVYDEKTGVIDYESNAKTENTRVSYPIYHIDNIVKPVSKGGHPSHVIFLTADAYGVLPPVAKLTEDQAKYHFLSGYTAKVAGTEIGVTEPKATFSTCFGAAFMLLHPTKYAEILGKKVNEHGSRVWLVNTGWSGGAYGTGKRMSIKLTRSIITAILENKLNDAEYEEMPIFNLAVPKAVDGIDDSSVLNPKNTWTDKAKYDETAKKLGAMFVKNFETFTDNDEGKRLVAAGPKL